MNCSSIWVLDYFGLWEKVRGWVQSRKMDMLLMRLNQMTWLQFASYLKFMSRWCSYLRGNLGIFQLNNRFLKSIRQPTCGLCLPPCEVFAGLCCCGTCIWRSLSVHVSEVTGKRQAMGLSLATNGFLFKYYNQINGNIVISLENGTKSVTIT